MKSVGGTPSLFCGSGCCGVILIFPPSFSGVFSDCVAPSVFYYLVLRHHTPRKRLHCDVIVVFDVVVVTITSKTTLRQHQNKHCFELRRCNPGKRKKLGNLPSLVVSLRHAAAWGYIPSRRCEPIWPVYEVEMVKRYLSTFDF